MIKAKEAKAITQSVELDEHILDAINIAIIVTNVSFILVPPVYFLLIYVLTLYVILKIHQKLIITNLQI